MEAPLPTASRRRSKVLVYDGDCPLCTGLTALLVRLRVIAPEERRAFGELEGELAARAERAGIGDQILVLDPETQELVGGARGLLWKLKETPLAPLARALDRPGAHAALETLYRFVALNRRYLSAPRPRAIPCACDPVERPAYQVAFVLVCGAVALLALIALGAAAPRALGLAGPRLGVLGPAVKAGWPWIFPALFAGTLGRLVGLRYVAHLAATAAACALVVALPALARVLVPGASAGAFETWLRVACVAAFALGLAMQRRRAAYQRLGGAWVLGWAACAGFGLFTLGWMPTLG